MKLIELNNKIFYSSEYLKDAFLFHGMEAAKESEDALIFSDEKEYVICREQADKPTWIWTADNTSIIALYEISKLLREKYLHTTWKHKFFAKQDVYTFLEKLPFSHLQLSDCFEVSALVGKHIALPPYCDGYGVQASMWDVGPLALNKYRERYGADDGDIKVAPYTEMFEKLSALAETGSLYVWKGRDHLVTSTLYYKIAGKCARLQGLHTPAEYRGKHYATNLVYFVSCCLHERGYTPMLYVDSGYTPSGSLYAKIGFEHTGSLFSFNCSKR